jgi:hypothetical protein
MNRAILLFSFLVFLALAKVNRPAKEPFMSDAQANYVDGCYDYAILIDNACGEMHASKQGRCEIEVQQECINMWDGKQAQLGEEE